MSIHGPFAVDSLPDCFLSLHLLISVFVSVRLGTMSRSPSASPQKDEIPDFGEDKTLVQRRVERVAFKSSGPKIVPVKVKHKTHAASARYNVKRADDLAQFARKQQRELSKEKRKSEKLAKKLEHSRRKREEIHKVNRQLEDERDEAILPGISTARDPSHRQRLIKERDRHLKALGLTLEEFNKATDLEIAQQAAKTAAKRKRPHTTSASSSSGDERQPTSTGILSPPTPDQQPGKKTKRSRQTSSSAEQVVRLDPEHYPQLTIHQDISVPPVKIVNTTGDTSARDVANVRWRQKYGSEPMVEPSTWELAPAAVPPRSVKGDRDWVVLTEKYVLQNFLSHLIAPHNIRYRLKTFAEHCHHQTVDWDAHPFCVECYKRFDLPRCSKGGNITCEFCDLNSSATDTARNDKFLSRRRSGMQNNRNLPSNVYTQPDADLYARKNRFLELPNPAWLLNDEPDGDCFPSSIVPFPVILIKSWAQMQPQWQDLAAHRRDVEELNNRQAIG